MEVRFATRALARCYEKHKDAVRKWGKDVAVKYIQRVNTLHSATSAEDLYRLPALHFHALTGNREGQFAISLVGRLRLIVTFDDEEQTAVCVAAVSNHYEQ